VIHAVGRQLMPTISLLTDFVCVEARGADAGAFLHAQLSRAIAPNGETHAPLAGWLDAHGRARALLRVWTLPDRWLLATPREGAPDLLKRLRMFVLRSAVALNLADDVALAALLDPTPEWLAARHLPPTAAPGSVTARGELRWLALGPHYWQVLGPRARVEALEPELARAPPPAAALAEIGLGLPAITPALVDRFVAQMLNLDALGAIAFDKGCYPGQEIVARVHNLGDVKRRVHRYAAATAPPAIGTAVSLRSGETVGEVVRSAPTAAGCELLAVVDQAAADAPLTVAAAALRELALPFAVPRR
jgi:folate-binding protein YgfZ